MSWSLKWNNNNTTPPKRQIERNNAWNEHVPRILFLALEHALAMECGHHN